MKSKRKRKLESKIGAFISRYQRKAHAGRDPNDRKYDRDMERKIKAMSPEELDDLIRGEDSEDNYRLYIGVEQLYFATFEEAKVEAKKHMEHKPELRIEVLIETELPDFWAYEYEHGKWVPS